MKCWWVVLPGLLACSPEAVPPENEAPLDAGTVPPAPMPDAGSGGVAPEPAAGGGGASGGVGTTGGAGPTAPTPPDAGPNPPAGGAGGMAPNTPVPDSVCPPERELIYRLDFSDPNWAGGEAGVIAALASLGTTIMAGADNVSVVQDPEHGTAIRVAYPENSGSIACAEDGGCDTEGGLVFRAPLPDGNTNSSLLLSYWVKFEEGFEWVKGGKLPGLCGGECATGGRLVAPDRFSIRYMWRSGGVGMVYSYLTNPPNSGTGLDMGVGSWDWENDGEWHHVQEELILNTGNDNDGVIRVWYDRPISETPNFEQDNLKYYDRVQFPNLGIDKLIFSTFHGGSDSSWSPGRDVHALFADFQVCR